MPKLQILNCFWLLVPILLWNAIFTPKLTQDGFQADDHVPSWILIAENVLRMLVFFLPLLLPLQWSDGWGKAGLAIYLVGTLIYFTSWLPLVYVADAPWSTSALGILAPFFTPLIVFMGLGLVGQSWLYLGVSALFIAVHSWHGVRGFRLL